MYNVQIQSLKTRDVDQNVNQMLGQRIRRWANIAATFGECLVFAAKWYMVVLVKLHMAV